MSDDRIKVLMYQYFLFRGDVYRSNAVESTLKLKTTQCLTVAEYEKIYRDILINELFNDIVTDVFNLLK